MLFVSYLDELRRGMVSVQSLRKAHAWLSNEGIALEVPEPLEAGCWPMFMLKV